MIMVHYLPKKKYLQLMHETSPAGSDIPPSTSSDDLSPTSDPRGASTPPPSTLSHAAERLGLYLEDSRPPAGCGDWSVAQERGHSREFKALGRFSDTNRSTDEQSDDDLFSQRQNVMLYNTDDKCSGDANELSKTSLSAAAATEGSSPREPPAARIFSSDDDGGTNLSVDPTALNDKNYCDDVASEEDEKMTRENDGEMLGGNRSSPELLDNNVVPDGLLPPRLPSFSNSLPDVDLLYGRDMHSSSFALFLNCLEAQGSPMAGCASGTFPPRTMTMGTRPDSMLCANNLAGIRPQHQPAASSSATTVPHFELSTAESARHDSRKDSNGGKEKHRYKPYCRQSSSPSGLSAMVNQGNGLMSTSSSLQIKEERADDEGDFDNGSGEYRKQTLTTTSGRNRGCGKAQEPKYVCQVCGDTAAGFHCGAYVCEACKKFYLRCLKSGGMPAFLCPKNNDCTIEKDTRSHCQYCRFQKCFRLGMYKPGREDDKKLKIDFRTIPCKVCNAPSSGFHFGAITCEGCKGFFRRMLKEQLRKKFLCTNGESCDIDSANRTTCKACRFAKCQRIGMKLEGTRLGRQSNSVKRSTLMEYKAGSGNGDETVRHRTSSHSQDHAQDSDDDDDAYSEHCPTGVMATPEAHVSRTDMPLSLSQRPYYPYNYTQDAQPSSLYNHDPSAAGRRSIGSSLSSGCRPAESTNSPPTDNSRCADSLPSVFRTTISVRDDLNNGNSHPFSGSNQTLGVDNSCHNPNATIGDQSRFLILPSIYKLERSINGAENGRPLQLLGSETDQRWLTSAHAAESSDGRWPARDVQGQFKVEGHGGYSFADTVHRGFPTISGDQSSGQMLSPLGDKIVMNFTSDSSSQLQLNHISIQPLTCVANNNFSPNLSSQSSCDAGCSAREASTSFHCSAQDNSLLLSHSGTTQGSNVGHYGDSGYTTNDRLIKTEGDFGILSDVALHPVIPGGSASQQPQSVEYPPPPKCRYPSGTSESLERERLMYQDPQTLFRCLTASFRELDDIMNRPQELDDLQHDAATLDTLWKLVEIPFMHQAKVVLKFVKKIPGFRQLPVDDQIKMAQDSLYPITLIYHSKYYSLETGEFNWFINTAEERDLILSVLPPFAALAKHFQSIGYALKSLSLSESEMAFLATMTAFTAADGSYLQASNDVKDLQEELLEAFMSFQTGMGVAGNNRIATLIARLPELQRANIEHRRIAAEVQQLAPQVEMSNLWQEVFLCGGRDRNTDDVGDLPTDGGENMAAGAERCDTDAQERGAEAL